MKRNFVWVGLGVAAACAMLPIDGAPAAARLFEKGVSIAQSLNQPKIELQLVAKQKLIQKDASGKEQITWSQVTKETTVQRGAVLKFQVVGRNLGDRPAQKLIVTQPIPKGTIYTIGSATKNNADVTYSIDGGKTFVANPMVQVTLPNGTTAMKPAPAEAYNLVRWTLSSSVAPQATAEMAYEVNVR